MDWSLLRADLNGSKERAFEELCVQLARIETETSDAASFVRLGTPDGGLEGYRALPDGTERGWQAKFFTSNLGPSQFKQLDESVDRALQTHPNLVHLTVCIPQDRSDPRKPGEEWFMDRWDKAVAKWTKWAQELGMSVRFEYWGDSELDQRLREERHAGRLWLWFREVALTHTWLQKAFAVTKGDAGQRYDPAVNVALPISDLFSGLLREPFWYTKTGEIAGRVAKSALRLQHLQDDVRFSDAAAPVLGSIQLALDTLSQIDPQEMTGSLPLDRVNDLLSRALDAIPALQDRLDLEPLNADEAAARPRFERSGLPRPVDSHALWNLEADVDRLVDFIGSDSSALAAGAPLILTGEAGAGKTHLLCDAAEARLNIGTPALVFLGQWFHAGDPLQQAIDKLHLACNPPQFLQALSSLAETRGRKALFVIDALNESTPRQVWRDHLRGLLETLHDYPWIGVVISCRTSYMELTLPEGAIPEGMVEAVHHGFGDQTFAAARLYFKHYGISHPPSPLTMPEFRNPLFLRLFCRSLQNSATVPLGEGVLRIFEMFLSAVDTQLSRRLDYNRNGRDMHRMLSLIAGTMLARNVRALPLSDLMSASDSIWANRPWSDSLLFGLISEGVLSSQLNSDNVDCVSFQYERLGDHLLAQRLLEGITADSLPESFSTGALATFTSRSRWDSIGLLEALAMQLPQQYGRELHDFVDVTDATFLASLIWRDTRTFTTSAWNRIRRTLSDPFGRRALYNVSLGLAGQTDHPLNADFLHEQLLPQTMVDRDADWTIYLNDSVEHENPGQLIAWGLSVQASDEYEPGATILVATALAWTFTASNRRIRDRATKALSNLLTGTLGVAPAILKRFALVNDPYVLERVTSAIYGAAMRSTDRLAILETARATIELFFETPGTLPIHLLTRDYLRGIIEVARRLDDSVKSAINVHPPYDSQFGDPPEESALSVLADRGNNRGLSLVWFSVMSHDFGRYTIGTNSGHFDWLPYRLGETHPTSPQDKVDAFAARLDDTQKAAWATLRQAQTIEVILHVVGADGEIDETRPPIRLHDGHGETRLSEESATASFRETLPAHLLREFDDVVVPAMNKPHRRPRFDLSLVQRAVLSYVVQTGYNELLGSYDERVNDRSFSRSPRLTERIGKKYQWQGLHRTLAQIADTYEFCGSSWNDDSSTYDGPWQIGDRDADPSFIENQAPYESRSSDWQTMAEAITHGPIYENDMSDQFGRLLTTEREGERWTLLHGDYSWHEQTPIGKDPDSVPRLSSWAMIHGYLVRKGEASCWWDWSSKQNWMGRWMPQPPDLHGVFRGEFYWAAAFHDSVGESLQWTRETTGGPEMPMDVMVAAVGYANEQGATDASLEDSHRIMLPAPTIAAGLALAWDGDAWSLLDTSDNRVAISEPTGEDHDRALWIKSDTFQAWLDAEELTLAWTILSEGRTLHSLGANRQTDDEIVYTGTAMLEGDRFRTSVRLANDDRNIIDAD